MKLVLYKCVECFSSLNRLLQNLQPCRLCRACADGGQLWRRQHLEQHGERRAGRGITLVLDFILLQLNAESSAGKVLFELLWSEPERHSDLLLRPHSCTDASLHPSIDDLCSQGWSTPGERGPTTHQSLILPPVSSSPSLTSRSVWFSVRPDCGSGCSRCLAFCHRGVGDRRLEWRCEAHSGG